MGAGSPPAPAARATPILLAPPGLLPFRPLPPRLVLLPQLGLQPGDPSQQLLHHRLGIGTEAIGGPGAMQGKGRPHRRLHPAGGAGQGPAQFGAEAGRTAIEGILQLQGGIGGTAAQVVEEGLEAQFQAATGGRITIKP